ncbi:MAG TPA: hypothetical protein VNI02_23480, partial [Blastocatellia bacterium]|nr:hypothetical protein [Blastocatellia bacterium]
NGLFTSLMLSIEGQEVKSDDVADRKEADRSAEGDKKDPNKKDAQPAPEPTDRARVFKFTIDCDYNKPRAEGDKPAPQPQSK